jgi:hypothetical protein
VRVAVQAPRIETQRDYQLVGARVLSVNGRLGELAK